jgi:PAS domain S-box-containing protein
VSLREPTNHILLSLQRGVVLPTHQSHRNEYSGLIRAQVLEKGDHVQRHIKPTISLLPTRSTSSHRVPAHCEVDFDTKNKRLYECCCVVVSKPFSNSLGYKITTESRYGDDFYFNPWYVASDTFFIGISRSSHFLDLTLDARLLYVSNSIVDILGYSPHEVIGKSCWEYFHPEEIPFAREIHGRGVKLDKAAVLTYCKIRDKHGFWVGCECVFTIVHDVLVACTSIYRRGWKSQSMYRCQ